MSSDLLIHNARVWVSAHSDIIENGSVLIRDGRIEKVGVFKARAHTVVDADQCLVMPGFIQGHVHLCQTIFRGIAEDLALLPWLRGYIWPLEAAHDEASIQASAKLACAEFIQSGTTAFLSMETIKHTDQTCEVVANAGLAGSLGFCLMDDTGGYPPLEVDTDECLEYCDGLLAHWRDHPRIKINMAPRFALSCSESNMRKACEYARDRGMMLHTHSSEQLDEVELVHRQTGRYNIDYLNEVGLTGPDVGLAHCVHTRPEEREILMETGTHVLHCPSANFKLGSGIAPVPEYLHQGINVSIGADGAPCNNRMDQFMEMREAGLMQKIRVAPDALNAREIVYMATEGGAKLLGWENEMGTLEVGKRANIILVDQSGFSVLPSTDPATNLVYSNNASDVKMTIVDGKILYEEGAFTTLDPDAVKAEVMEQRRKLLARADL